MLLDSPVNELRVAPSLQGALGNKESLLPTSQDRIYLVVLGGVQAIGFPSPKHEQIAESLIDFIVQGQSVVILLSEENIAGWPIGFLLVVTPG